VLSVLTQKTQREPPNTFDVKILDGAAVVHFRPTTNIITFDEYASGVLVPRIMKHLESSKDRGPGPVTVARDRGTGNVERRTMIMARYRGPGTDDR
jgi:hypothetical protein